jgi:hypothetical protein
MKIINFLLAFIVLALLFSLCIILDFPNNSDSNPSVKQINDLTAWLNKEHILLYYRYNCEYCIEQEKYINISNLTGGIEVLNLSDMTWLPNYSQINGTPTWEMPNGTYEVGVMNYAQLKEWSGYKGK